MQGRDFAARNLIIRFGTAVRASCRSPPGHPLSRPRRGAARPDPFGPAARASVAFCKRSVLGVEYLIRQARITDIDRLAALDRPAIRGSGRGSLDAADLLRQLVYLPHASVLVAEVRREIVGGALLVLRPSVVAGGYVGTVDLLVVAPNHDADRVTEALLEELLRSAGNKGCTEFEMAQPADPPDLARLERAGFAPAGPTLRRPLATARRP